MKPALQRLHEDSQAQGGNIAEWWWCRTEALHVIGQALVQDCFVVIDHFLPLTEARSIRSEVVAAYEQGLLTQEGVIGGGRFGRSESFTDKALRSDVLGYFDGTEPEWVKNGTNLQRVLDKMVVAVPRSA